MPGMQLNLVEPTNVKREEEEKEIRWRQNKERDIKKDKMGYGREMGDGGRCRDAEEESLM